MTQETSTSTSTSTSMTSRQTSLPLILIAAVSPSNGIGSSGGLPWKLSGEMAYFRRVTNFIPSERAQQSGVVLKNAVLMGKNTWNSIPTKFRPLKGRINVVVSSKATVSELAISQCADTHLFPSLSEAIRYLQSRLPSSSSPSTSTSNSDMTSSTPSESTAYLNRTFLIGGAQLYSQLLTSDSSSDHHLSHLLLTRIFSPQFKNCDVFIPEFRSKDQIKEEYKEVKKVLEELDLQDSILEGGLQDHDSKWKKSPGKEFKKFIGEEIGDEEEVGIDLKKETNKEQGSEDEEVHYEFQMWVPKNSA